MNQSQIPAKGISENEIFNQLASFKNRDIDWKNGKTFGAVYYPGEAYAEIISKAYKMYMHENAFDPQLFKSLLDMENEIIRQIGSLFSSSKVGESCSKLIKGTD